MPRPCAVVDVSRIAAFEPFAGLPPAELDELAGVMSEVEVEAGAPVVTHGDFGYVLYAIEAGEADVIVDGEVTGRTLGPGDTFGEIALLVTGRRTATIVARTDMRVLSLFDQDFRRLRDRVPELDRTLRRLGGERLAQ
jgi:CRP-like cAMP-binding protein